MTRITKAITYSQPTSVNAIKLGFPTTGCWHVSLTALNIEGSGQCLTYLPVGCEGFVQATDPDLISLYLKEEGEMCKHFAQYGYPDVHEAIKAGKAKA